MYSNILGDNRQGIGQGWAKECYIIFILYYIYDIALHYLDLDKF